MIKSIRKLYKEGQWRDISGNYDKQKVIIKVIEMFKVEILKNEVWYQIQKRKFFYCSLTKEVSR